MTRKKRIEEKLSTLNPLHLEVMDESHQHAVPKGAESHFKITVVSEAFTGLKTVARHRCIYQLLAEELSSGLHALSMTLLTPAETSEGQSIPVSPACLGGKRRE